MTVRHTTNLLGALALLLLSAAQVGAQTTVIIDDSWADGDRAITGSSGSDVEAAFYASTNSNGIEDSVGLLGMVSAGAGRGIHAPFPTQTLENIGDQLTLSYTFTTPETISRGCSACFRIGLFDTTNVIPSDNSASYNQDITSSADSIHASLTGFMMDHDVNTPDEADLNFRSRNPGSDRLLSTTGAYSTIGDSSAPNGDYEFVSNTEFSGSIAVERVSATEVMLSGAISGNGGGTTHEVVYEPDSFDINLLAFHANSNVFGEPNADGDNLPDFPNNGLDFSNISVTFSAVPEPSSAILCLGALAGICLIRRRR